MTTAVGMVLQVAVVFVVLSSAGLSWADEQSLASLLNERLAPAGGLPVQLCSDAEFLRRVSLDLTGMPPAADEARAFLSDPGEDKRQRLVDRLLQSPHCDRHLAAVLDVMLMERRANQHVGQDEWLVWLLTSVREQKPWNQLVRELLAADGSDPAQRPAARFALDRGGESQVIARDIGRIFFGCDLQCAQCHDHPLVDDYHQSDYHGLLAFTAAGYPVAIPAGDKELTVYAEKAGTDLTYESVFIKGVPHRTGPRLPDGIAIVEPFHLPGEEYEVAPADKVKSVPKFSRRARLAELATDGSHRSFNENIANRLWALMFGRGLVQPVDMHHSGNPAFDPELLQILGERFAAMQFNIRSFLREIALSDVYQRAIDLPAHPATASAAVAALLPQLEEQQAQLEQALSESAAAYNAARDAWNQTEAAAIPVAAELDTARNQYADVFKPLDEANRALADVSAQLMLKQAAKDPLQVAAAAAQDAAAKLPGDGEIAAAAQKFVERAQQVVAEVDTLQKSVEEKTAALQPLQEAVTAARPTVDAVLAKLQPLQEAVRQQDEQMLTARRRMIADATALASLEQRLETYRRVAQLTDLSAAIIAAHEDVSTRTAAHAAAEEQLAEFAAEVAQRDANVNAAVTMLSTQQAALEAAMSEQARRVTNAESVANAFAAAETARQQLPDDTVVAEAAAKLQARLGELQALTAEAEQMVASAAASMESAKAGVNDAKALQAEAEAERTRREQLVASAQAAIDVATAEVATRQTSYDTAVEELAGRWTADFTIASLKPLTPEQLCWSIFRVTGVYQNYWNAEAAELEKSAPLTEEQKQDPAAVLSRSREIEQRTFDKLKGNLGTFVQIYGAGAGQPQGDFFASVDQALFAANGGAINSWVSPSGDNVTQRMVAATESRQAAEELYLAVFTRFPTEEEVADVDKYLGGRTENRVAAAQELVWGLINSAEFRFNH